jgi:hypothetical protein
MAKLSKNSKFTNLQNVHKLIQNALPDDMDDINIILLSGS